MDSAISAMLDDAHELLAGLTGTTVDLGDGSVACAGGDVSTQPRIVDGAVQMVRAAVVSVSKADQATRPADGGRATLRDEAMRIERVQETETGWVVSLVGATE